MKLWAAETGVVAATRLRAGPVRPVVATFRHSAYLEGGICLAPPDLPRGPLVARLQALPRLRVGDAVELDPGSVWSPAPCRCPDPSGLEAALRGALRQADWRPWFTAWPSHAAASALLGALPDLPANAQVLVGLGPGLTPAGDDVLAGYALCRRALGREVPALDLRGTGAISRELLACALVGLPAEDEAALITGPTLAAALRVALHGATSGLATLLGMLAALTRSGAMQP